MEKQFVSFWVGSRTYCIDIMKVQEVVRENRITQMPDVPQYVEGIVNLRGVVTPVISVRKKLGITEKVISKINEKMDAVRQSSEELSESASDVEKQVHDIKELEEEEDDYLKLIIVHIEGVQVGFLVDSLDRVFDVDEAEIQSAEGVAGNIDSKFVEGAIRKDDDVYIILNAWRMLDMEEKKFLQEEIIE